MPPGLPVPARLDDTQPSKVAAVPLSEDTPRASPSAAIDNDTSILRTPAGNRSIQEELEAAVCLPLQRPVLRTRPWLRRARTPVSSLRRSRRIAARPRAANATRQAQNLLLKKLGEVVEESAPDAEVASKFMAAFGGNLTERKKQVMQIVLNGEFDLSAMDLDLTGLEDELART